MKINEVLIEPFEFHSAIIESNDDLIEYAQIIASDMLQYGLATSDRDWRHIFRHLVRESINDQITQFIDRFKSLDERTDIKIKIGTTLALLNLSILSNTSDKAYLYGFVDPKIITKIYREPSNNKIIQIEFNNNPADVYPRQYRGVYNNTDIDHSIFLKNKQSAVNAVTLLKTSAPDNMLDTKGVKGI